MTTYIFNTRPVIVGEPIRDASFQEIESTPSLYGASLTNAALFGGPVVRRVLESAPIVGDKLHITVDTKVTFLMPGWYPSIPGWHTDGVPRGEKGDPRGPGDPSLRAQADADFVGLRPRFHTMVLGLPCLTRFVQHKLSLDLEHPTDPKLYAEITELVDALGEISVVEPPVGCWASWDWWNLHSASPATATGWRLLVRVTESDRPPSEQGFIRAQNQVYVPTVFGW